MNIVSIMVGCNFGAETCNITSICRCSEAGTW